MRKFKNLFHLALFVNDLEASVDFYNRLGMDTVFTLNKEDGSPWLTYVRIAENQYLELFPVSENDPQMPHKEIVQSMSDPLGHFAIQVNDLKACAVEWAKKGIEMLYTPIEDKVIPVDNFDAPVGSDGCIIGWVVDPDGNKIEVMEQPGNTKQQMWEKEHPYI